jgi:Amt family ammonium transporter
VHAIGGSRDGARDHLGPRIGKYDEHGKPRAFPAHNIVFVVTGTFILLFGWMGFNPGRRSAPRISASRRRGQHEPRRGGRRRAAMVVWDLMFGKPDISMACNGMLAGLVAITAPCAFVSANRPSIIGVIAGVDRLRRRAVQRARRLKV